MMKERGVPVDHSSINRQAIRFLLLIRPASNMLAGAGLMQMIRKDQFAIDGTIAILFADQFDALTGQIGKVRFVLHNATTLF